MNKHGRPRHEKMEIGCHYGAISSRRISRFGSENVMAFNFLCLNQPKEALTAARNAIRLSPGAPEFYLLVTADAQMMLRRFEEVLPLLARILARRPRWLMAWAMATICLEARGRHDEAHAMVRELLELSSNFSVQRWRRCLHNPDRPDTAQSADMLKAVGIPA
jgi:tetratricopeptide (TPR) repeat protein